MDMSGFNSFAERIDARKIRERSPSFLDHFSQATLFFNSQSEPGRTTSFGLCALNLAR